MAVAVDISGSKHLSYSPLNEKHNILYSGARQCFNQRYKQRPWFRLNPITDKSVGKGENIERYDPECDAGLSLPQSLVIVEDYFSDMPQFTKEFNIGEFWDFLFSDSWSDGYSVRVFEGQLLEMIVTCLLSLTRASKVVQHVTKAYAKNKRQKYSIVKQATKKDPELIPFTETLLLKFVYYGHVVKPDCFDPESSVGYPDVTTTTTTTTATNSSCVREAIDFDPLGNDKDTTRSTTGLRTSDTKSPSPPPGEPQGPTQHPRKRRVRAPHEIQNHIEKERLLMSRFMSYNDSIIPAPPPIPRDKNYRYTCSNFSNASDDYKSLPPRVDLNHFICTEKVSYLGEFNLPDDNDSPSCSSGEEDDNDNFEQHYYLGDPDQPIREDVFESTEIKLKKRKEVVQHIREEKKLHIAQLKQPKPKIMPEFSDLDIKKYVKDHKITNVTGAPESEKVPTLEEYAECLEADEKREAKLKIRKMASKTMTKNVISKQRVISMVKSGIKAPQTGLKVSANLKINSPAQRMMLLEKMLKSKKKPPKVVQRTNKIEVPLVYLSVPSGLTFLHPCSRHLMQTKIAEEAAKRRQGSPTKLKKRRMSLLPTVGTALFNELQKVRQDSKSTVCSSDGVDNGLTKPKFPKIKLIPSNVSIESSDSDDSDDECDDLDQSIFDSKKLNIQYSKDRIKKAKAARMSEEKKNKGHIYDVLKKYCRMQSILKALGGPTKKPRRQSIGGVPSKIKRKKKTNEISKSSQIEVVESNQHESNQYTNVGKLKHFAFLEAKEKTAIQSSQPMKSLFENYPIELFCENLERALKEFVVRREIVVSDYNGKTLVSITFTKKSVFTSSKFSTNQ